jgi:hypothetical protein
LEKERKKNLQKRAFNPTTEAVGSPSPTIDKILISIKMVIVGIYSQRARIDVVTATEMGAVRLNAVMR